MSRSGVKLTIEEMHKIAESRGGKCLSLTYKNNRTKLQWQCECGYEWLAVPKSIKLGSWCPVCGIKKRSDERRGTIEEAQALAESKGGKCLSTKYVNARSILKWICKYGHTWEATKSSIKHNNTWCPLCSVYTSERTIGSLLEQLLGYPFKKVRPEGLLNEAGNQMEIDLVSEKLNLYVEIQGIHHYEYTPRFHRTIEDFKKRRRNDRIKVKWCIANDKRFMAIPALGIVKLKDQKDYIKKELEKIGYDIPDNYNNILFDITKIPFNGDMINKMQALAESKGGKCLSTKYVNARIKLDWQCLCGHMWSALPGDIKRSGWCPICRKKDGADKCRGTIEERQALAESKGGKCLSTKYVNARIKLDWQCKHGHTFSSTPGHAKRHWCKHCNKINRKAKP